MAPRVIPPRVRANACGTAPQRQQQQQPQPPRHYPFEQALRTLKTKAKPQPKPPFISLLNVKSEETLEEPEAWWADLAAVKEEETAESIDAREEKTNRSARYGNEHKLPETGKKVALKKMLIGKTRDNFKLWGYESPKLTFEALMKRVKDQARSKELERDVQRGRTVSYTHLTLPTKA